ncbi:CheY-like receiver, AAA-type ATPase, and DNA-binding domain containing response regulator [Desulfocurvibacter africanus PCS]|uniref:histidine kinase n=1 Tax=Desulfocurvibacter africanus PCS TaxID=1262666 RepID=M5PT66_DESAF|nr:response regulator [Desulfocurvibacter africanus]EMG37314.1 CheY-like receiver, AAA-type ATPase, and DNA-binding domain containing response regulator [Desulfocurvibacter africanus PCS]
MSHGKPAILLVDDEPGILRVLSMDLEDRGHMVHSAGDAHEALAIFNRERPCIVLTDIRMPGIDGIGLLGLLKEIEPETEVIMITGHGDMDLAVRSLQLDATDFLTKPIDFDLLEIALKRAEERLSLRSIVREHTENLERLVEEKSRKLIHAERMAAVGETAAGLAHGIKNIASGLACGRYLVDRGLESDNKSHVLQGWEMVRHHVENIERLSRNLLDFAKPPRLCLAPTPPDVPARQAYRIMLPKANDAQVALSLNVAAGLVPVLLDPEAMQRVLVDLLANALDACAGEENPDSAKRVELTISQPEGRGALYEVIDTGPGFDAEVGRMLFTRFFTTKGASGTGLGLMLCRRTVEAHGGTIRAESSKGEGAKFLVCLP